MDDVVKITVFLADLADFAACNEEYRRHFAEPYPARSTVQAGLAPGLLVEIEVVARGGRSDRVTRLRRTSRPRRSPGRRRPGPG